MKTKSKLKETEIGMIPEDWEVKNVMQLGKVITGKTPKTESKDNFGQEYPFVTPRDMKGQKYIFETERYLSGKGKNSVKNCLIPKNSICVSCIGSDMGKVVMTTEECITNQQINSIVPNISSDFVYYAILNISASIKNLGKQSTAVPILNKSQFSKVEITIPSLTIETEKIAKILSDLDDKIGLNQQMNKTLESIGQAIFKRWFVDFEFPNEQGKPYKSSGGKMTNSEVGEIPKGWEVKPIDEIAGFLNGLALQNYPPESEDEYLPVIKIRELRQGITDSSDKASTKISKEYIINDGDVLFSWSGSLELVIWTRGKGALNQHLFKVTSEKYPKWFYYYWVMHHLPEYRQIAEGKATTMGHIQRHHLKNSFALVPNYDALSKMDKALNPVFEKLIFANVESEKLSQIRDSLLPRLMLGKIRVPIEARA
ncbi:MAG: restriction endonuclease subunit S [Candidatus Omnitrophica bacterium]|nr:restriction endonuclease subunit S [Candidatus Omnitrophota bacterium]